ncbi:DUF2721 domain-containing protein [Aliarcobacter cryaerophilus]|uniref:DUF2721 domain-containing protein n=1 Tax=Aliarcobacter cryaerophilus TaxID=28198 RepID=UPI0021B4ED62|nr:DUF2721 domain-containing protein [Aliarcobacter cryaerophilus]MCT7489171.1 DUF2721 domain-containing protein [Aliarcobacter cryaerophilus]
MINQIETNTISSMIQLSIAPVFLLAGVGALLNVFTGRLVRIIDKIDKLDKYEYENSVLMEDKKLQQIIEQRREHLVLRMINTNRAILFGTITGLLISLVIITIFLSSFFHFEHTILIATLFILSLSSLIVSFILFVKELFYTTKFIKNKESYIP